SASRASSGSGPVMPGSYGATARGKRLLHLTRESRTATMRTTGWHGRAASRCACLDRRGIGSLPSPSDLDRLDNSLTPVTASPSGSWMSRFADIGAAVIGTGFIGTVHVEQL